MTLSDRSIRIYLKSTLLVIDPPPTDDRIQPASVDLTLGPNFMSPYEDKIHRYDKALFLTAGECMLGETVEHIEIPSHMVARIEGKSSWGRRFISVHTTAGFIDPGFRGKLTLELVNLSKIGQVLPVGEPIAQLSFQFLTTDVLRSYGHPELKSHYQDQAGVTPSAVPWS